MTVLRTKSENKTILDLSQVEVNKKIVKKLLNNLKLTNTYNKNNYLIIVDNIVKVGSYLVFLGVDFPENFGIFGEYNLKKIKSLHIEIFQLNKNNQMGKIVLEKDLRFKNQYWLENNRKNSLKFNDLIDILVHCQRVNKLQVFS